MDKTLLVDLKKKIFLRSALISIDSLDEIFSLNSMFTGDEILFELFKKSLRAFEFHHPLVWESRISEDYLQGSSFRDNYSEIKTNFHLYLNCQISADQIVLVPNSTPYIRLGTSYPTTGSYFLPADYDRPYICFGGSIPATQFYLKGICSRPIIVDYTKDLKFTKKGAIYWINIEEGVLGQKFVDQCMTDVLEYIRNLKGNFSLPNFPVDIFGAVEIAYQQLKAELDQYYLQSAWRGDFLV